MPEKKERINEVMELIDGLNRHIAAEVEKDPEKFALVCSECGEKYVPKDLAEFFVCPICGKTQQDEDASAGGENASTDD